jgi:hypothetical protein
MSGVGKVASGAFGTALAEPSSGGSFPVGNAWDVER